MGEQANFGGKKPFKDFMLKDFNILLIHEQNEDQELVLGAVGGQQPANLAFLIRSNPAPC